MAIDWDLASRYIAPTATLILGIVINRLIERNPKVNFSLGYASRVTLPSEGGAPIVVHSHTAFISNVGKKVASNVRVSHWHLPSFDVFPDVPYEVVNLPRGGAEIVFSKLIPGEMLTISYLYYPPHTYNEVNETVRFDEGFAKQVAVSLTPHVKPALRWFFIFLELLGFLALIYLLVEALRALVR
ncbi:MAG: hypothetical protein ACO1SV_21635 [Fimbriimonas sp.]